MKQRVKLFSGLVMIAGIWMVLVLRGRENPKELLTTEEVSDYFSVFFSLLPKEEVEQWKQKQAAAMEPSVLMEMAKWFVSRDLVDKGVLAGLEQGLAVWQKKKGGMRKEMLRQTYVLLAEHSNRPECISRRDIFCLGKEDTPSRFWTTLGEFKVKEGTESLVCGRGYDVVLEGDCITCVLGCARGEIRLNNAWIIEAQEDTLTVFYRGITSKLPLKQPMENRIEGEVADVTLSGDDVVGIAVKNHRITGKVLCADKEGVEVEGYGRLLFEEDYKIYKIYGEPAEEKTAAILVGYTVTSFAISGNKISAALLTEPIQVTNIRVLIQNSSYHGYEHEELLISADSRFYVSDGDAVTAWYEAGEEILITKEMLKKTAGRLYLGTQRENGRLILPKVKRSGGVPSYRGTMEITQGNDGLILVNELPMEEYLYGVVPSEMSASFGSEALKAQAVCARSYACRQMLSNRFSAYGAHVDDSTASQVYMNYGENEETTYAVKDTYGKILTYQGKCIHAYYFSCSYGHTSDGGDVWGEGGNIKYLQGGCQTAKGGREELSKEEDFLRFFYGEREWLDRECAWFRWKTTLPFGCEELLYQRLCERYAAAPELVLKQKKDAGARERYVSEAIEPLGTLLDIEITQRGRSGIVTEVRLVGSRCSYLLLREYTIRAVLADMAAITLADGRTTQGMSLLPSAYMRIQKNEEGFSIEGGGYGHGVGMSQYGARALAAGGEEYEAILLHFYPETELTFLYEPEKK